jgi:hypothetical protein
MRQSIPLKFGLILGALAAVGGIVPLAGKSGLPPSNTAPSSTPTLTSPSAVTSAPQTSVSASSSDIINWKIYHNSDFEIKYLNSERIFRYLQRMKDFLIYANIAFHNIYILIVQKRYGSIIHYVKYRNSNGQL